MRNKVTVIVASLAITTFIMSVGYGLWEDRLTIRLDIEVVDVISNGNSMLESTVMDVVYGKPEPTVMEEVYGE